MMTTESSSLVDRKSPALVAGFSFVPNDRLCPNPALQNLDFQQFKGPLYPQCC